MVMVMNGFNTNFDAEGNQIYAVNTVAFHYVNEPIAVERDAPVRIYLVNMLEYDPINSFHIHGNFFNHFPTGTSLTPTEFTDTIIQGQAQRAVLEMCFPYTGDFMFHAHKTEFAELGWMGFFRVGGEAARRPRPLPSASSATRPVGDDPARSEGCYPMEAGSRAAPRAADGARLGARRRPAGADRGRDRRLRAPRRARASTSAAARRSRTWRSSAPCSAPARSS